MPAARRICARCDKRIMKWWVRDDATYCKKCILLRLAAERLIIPQG